MFLIQFVFGLVILIIVHELGHFIAARLLKVEVEEFGIGFPPRLTKMFEWKGTAFTLNWIPLGGFVRPKGENDPNIPGGLAAANPWVRLAVFFAGPVMNLLVGLALATLFFFNIGSPILDQVLISKVNPGSPAEAASLQPGDLFISVNDSKIDSVKILTDLTAQNLGKPVEITVKRSDQIINVTLTPRPAPPEGEGPMGVVLDHPSLPITWLEAAQLSAQNSYQYVSALLTLPPRLIMGQAQPGEMDVKGLPGMYQIYEEVRDPLWFFWIISLSLGIMNLLPIPALDGGRILFALPEIIVRRRVPAEFENAVHFVGFALLVLLLLYINGKELIQILAPK